MEEKKLAESFETFLTKVVEHDAVHKVKLEAVEKTIKEVKEKIEKLNAEITDLNETINKGVVPWTEKRQKWLDLFQQRNYTDQEVSELGAHVYESHQMFIFHKWFKGKLAIVVGTILVILALLGFADQLHIFLNWIQGVK